MATILTSETTSNAGERILSVLTDENEQVGLINYIRNYDPDAIFGAFSGQNLTYSANGKNLSLVGYTYTIHQEVLADYEEKKDPAVIPNFNREKKGIAGSFIYSDQGGHGSILDISDTEIEDFTQLSPFDLEITRVNHKGQIIKRTIYGVIIVNEGGGSCIDDMEVQTAYTYVADRVTPWRLVSE